MRENCSSLSQFKSGGIFAEFDEPCLWLVESKESSPVDEEEIKIKIDDGVDTLLRGN